MFDGGRETYVGRMGTSNGGAPGEVADTEAAQGDSEEGRRGALGQKGGGYVYFIEAEGWEFVKIGRVFTRLLELGTLRPRNFRLQLLGCIPGTRQTET
jgi:hypothetical protein